ncbi:MAG: lactate utilization protein [Methylophaga sp.]|nr:MAG: lactate utilization protein [Methylophaga sp.]
MDEQNKESKRVILQKIRSATKSDEYSHKDNILRSRMKKNKSTEIKYVSNLDVFISKLEQAKATVSVVSHKRDIITEVHKYVSQHQISSVITVAQHTDFPSLDWEGVDTTTQYNPKALSTSVTFAVMGIEETGALVMLSSPSSPTGMNFLPDHHFIVLDADKVVKTMEDVWAQLSKSGEPLPRTINLITGPSRTADIEYEIQIGAHGPKSLHVIIVKNH